MRRIDDLRLMIDDYKERRRIADCGFEIASSSFGLLAMTGRGREEGLMITELRR